MTNTNFKWPLILIALVIVGFVAYGVLTMKDTRSPGERISDAYHSLDEGPTKAARQLEDRTPGQKLGDAVKDSGDKIKDSTKSPDSN